MTRGKCGLWVCCVSLWRGFFHTSGCLPWPAQEKAITPVHVGRELNLRHVAGDLAHVLEFGGEQFWCPGVAVMLHAEDMMCHFQLLWLSEVDVPVMLKASKFHWTDWCVHSNNSFNLSLFSENFLRLYCRHYPTFWYLIRVTCLDWEPAYHLFPVIVFAHALKLFNFSLL